MRRKTWMLSTLLLVIFAAPSVEAKGWLARWRRTAPIVPKTVVAPQRDVLMEALSRDPVFKRQAPKLKQLLTVTAMKVSRDNRRLLRRGNMGMVCKGMGTLCTVAVCTEFGLIPAMATAVPAVGLPTIFEAKSEVRAKNNVHDFRSFAVREGGKLGLDAVASERIAAQLLLPLRQQINRNLSVRVNRFFFGSSPQDAGIEEYGR